MSTIQPANFLVSQFSVSVFSGSFLCSDCWAVLFCSDGWPCVNSLPTFGGAELEYNYSVLERAGHTQARQIITSYWCMLAKGTQHEHHLCVPFGATYEQTTWLASGSLANMFALHQCSLNKERDHMRSIQFGCSGQLCYSGLNSCTCILTNFRAQVYLDPRAAAKIGGQTLRVVPLHAGG